jgi:beta-galactosidase
MRLCAAACLLAFATSCESQKHGDPGPVSRTGIAPSAAEIRERAFDSDWRFLRADVVGAEMPGFDDAVWRRVDLPHDWSIEDLPSTNGEAASPFNATQSGGGAATGFVVGGTGWYRKRFTLSPPDSGKKVSVRFDGVYMNSDVWVNGQHLGNHPYGYTPFVYDLTPYLKPAGQENVLAVRVKNTGKNSRWYSGSGIYRHVWLTVTDPVHIPTWGVYVVTTNASSAMASVQVSTTIENSQETDAAVRLRVKVVGPNGKATAGEESEVKISAGKSQEVAQTLAVSKPVFWSLNNPALYRAEVEVVQNGQIVDRSSATFGIRTLRFTAEKGFELNGEVVKLKGGCMHHDNGPLGAATIDRAEERRVQLMKAYGFNAIRTSHNPPSPQFLDACDRNGVLVLDEAFDMWERAKNPDDYHLYFDDWWKRDLEAMVLRDRNHPSVILWSVGNEINERAEPSGVALCEQMVSVVKQLDNTRGVTEAICSFWDHPGKKWPDTAPGFAPLDVGGYNYEWRQYARDHETFPLRVMMGTESYPKEVFDNWQAVLTNSWVIGDFVWTAWDYLGETGIGNASVQNGREANRLPWFDAWCGDIDTCGFEKPQHYYREVVWGDSKMTMAVHAPIPEGHTERVSGWGWPDERQSWTWPGSEGKELDVTVYSSCPSVRLELNGKEIATQPVNNKMVARFKVPYQPGELHAIGLDKTAVASTVLRTAGQPKEIRLKADRSVIRDDRNDLSYVTVEVVDQHGVVVPNADLPIHFTVSGAGELAATGSPAPNDASSFHLPVRKTFQGRCLAILRPNGGAGTIVLKAEADGLKSATITVKTR